jgi:hypothetical protein
MDEEHYQYDVLYHLNVLYHMGPRNGATLPEIMDDLGLPFGEALCGIASLMDMGFVSEKAGFFRRFSRGGKSAYRITHLGRAYLENAPSVRSMLGGRFDSAERE